MAGKRKRTRLTDGKNSNRERPWSDLPEDILQLIMERLAFIDQIRFRAVCKRWQSIERVSRPNVDRVHSENQLPWLMVFERRPFNSYKLYDPCRKKAYDMDAGAKVPEDLRCLQVCAAKSGWLLLSKGHPRGTSFFLYCPFTKEWIDLPVLDFDIDAATFSTSPTSPDCIFFALHSPVDAYTVSVIINTYRRGDKTWTKYNFNVGFWLVKNAVYSEGKFYCSTRRGTLGAFDVSRKDWNVLALPGSAYVDDPMYDTYLLESKGELRLVILSEKGRWSKIFRLDRAQMSWVRVESLQDRALFLGSTSFSVSVSDSVKARRQIADKIYYCREEDPAKFYSLKARKRYVCTATYGCLAVVGGKKIWIEPPY
ncbi:PREDICTED: F-box/kelch-repeat protein At1g57790-like [Nelumbo nucifera]|uniref:F-box/kelch-repeat protein At1g57790-like n=2 Tax=Nelumbo nucifera TaxID=4432 RepID=A0A1U8AZW7_NELNU|nr:PREDICTED: F-box/kelch-repeat protein At1g57790-like [Nelumbo nucifera]DAD22366.1 TPA_asm: hypothetical protein HUJ06_023829 [Nelumbo nucifera]